MLRTNIVDRKLLKSQKYSLVRVIANTQINKQLTYEELKHFNGILCLLDFIGDHLEDSGTITLKEK